MRQIPLVWLTVAGCATEMTESPPPPVKCPGHSATIVFPKDGAVVPPGALDAEIDWDKPIPEYANVYDDAGQLQFGGHQDIFGRDIISHWIDLQPGAKFTIETGWFCIDDVNPDNIMTIPVAVNHFTTSAM
jgi:hypothetical protein